MRGPDSTGRLGLPGSCDDLSVPEPTTGRWPPPIREPLRTEDAWHHRDCLRDLSSDPPDTVLMYESDEIGRLSPDAA